MNTDDPIKELTEILNKHGVLDHMPREQLKGLLVDLSIYTVNRDYKVLEHGKQLERMSHD